MCLAARFRPDLLGSYSTPPGPRAVIRGRGGEGEKERVGNREGDEEESKGKT